VLKQKAQMVIDLYLDSQLAPSTQIDVSHDIQQKLIRSAQKIVQGTFTANDLQIFDDTRAQLFKDLLPYWAGYKFNCSKLEPGAGLPLTKQEKLLRERLEEFLQMKNPSLSDFKLPSLSPVPPTATPTGTRSQFHQSGQKANLNICFSIAAGIKYKDDRQTAQLISGSQIINNNGNSNSNNNSNSNPTNNVPLARRNSIHVK
jgi:hypothetical protein